MKITRIFCIVLNLFILQSTSGHTLSWLFKEKDKTYQTCEDGDNGSDLKSQFFKAAQNGEIETVKKIINQVENDTSRWTNKDKFNTSNWVNTVCDKDDNTAFSVALRNAHMAVASYLLEKNLAKTEYTTMEHKKVSACPKAIIYQENLKRKIEKVKQIVAQSSKTTALTPITLTFLEKQDFAYKTCSNQAEYIACARKVTGQTCECRKKKNTKACKVDSDLEKCKKQQCYYILKDCISNYLNSKKDQIEQNIREIRNLCNSLNINPSISSFPFEPSDTRKTTEYSADAPKQRSETTPKIDTTEDALFADETLPIDKKVNPTSDSTVFAKDLKTYDENPNSSSDSIFAS